MKNLSSNQGIFLKTYITEIHSKGVESYTDTMIKKGVKNKDDSSPHYHEDGSLWL